MYLFKSSSLASLTIEKSSKDPFTSELKNLFIRWGIQFMYRIYIKYVYP